MPRGIYPHKSKKGKEAPNWRGGISGTWDKRHPERRRERQRKWRKKHLKKCRKQTLKAVHRYRQKYPERYKESLKKYREKHKEKRNFESRMRRIRKKNAGYFAFEEWIELKKKYKNTCLCCKKIEPEIKLVPDHIIPLCKNGENKITNIQPLCLVCNLKKGIKIKDFKF